MKPFLILQLRPEDEASDNEYEAFLRAGGLKEQETHRIRIEREGIKNIKLTDYSGVIVGGGPYCVSDINKSEEQQRFEHELEQLLEEIIEHDFPYLGACYGLGILAKILGGKVSKEKYGEGIGAISVKKTEAAFKDKLLKNLPEQFKVFGGHKEACQDIPPKSVLLASSASCPVQMIKVKENIYATQFHAELDAEGLALRINVYRHAGYFPAHEADELIALVSLETVVIPEKIFRSFVQQYRVKQ